MPFSTPSVLRFLNLFSFKRESGAKRAFFMRETNPIGVLLLIAQGWRGTSLPWVNMLSGAQRHRCCASFD